jgi:hypothetical protein
LWHDGKQTCIYRRQFFGRAGNRESWDVSLLKFFLDVFVTLFVIIDPAGTVPVFLGLTRGRSELARANVAFVPLGTPPAVRVLW